MKINKLFLGLFAYAALSACSNDESGIIPNDVPKVFTGNEAYIRVRLTDAVTSTRATSKDNDFEYGTAEQEVENAHFYFYDENGVFVAQGNAWNDGNSETGNPAGNIEFKSNTVVVLKGLSNKMYPKYMVTVLNKPNTFIHGNTLDEMEVALADNAAEGIYYPKNDVNYFAMSTTSFAEQGLMKSFVTEVEEANFSLEPISGAGIYPVTIYVERLAAKVSLGVAQKLEESKIDGRYLIKATVAGEPNAGGGNNIAAEDLYVELLGWKLNATAKKSYIVKNIDESWTHASLGFTWNMPIYFRSYWGKSFNYGKPGYPENAAGAATSEYLNYVNLKSNCVEMGKAAYCAENTNTSEILSATRNFPSAVTSILLKAKICDKVGNALNLVRFNGVLFNQDSFLQYMLNILSARGELNVWYEDGVNENGNKKYTQIGKEFVNLVNVSDGVVKVEFTNNNNIPLYSKVNDTTFNPITNFSDLNVNLAEVSEGAIGYTGGLMYYNIPIEHLNEADIIESKIPEAKYGVVRNHRYIVTINKLENIGKGIFDEEEVIVPSDEDDETYFVSANINILSWKIVSQDVDL
nr:Mfa1 family fimbria major subunit [uncultured Bacteroides sp.]